MDLTFNQQPLLVQGIDQKSFLDIAEGFAEPQPLTPITPISYPAPVEKESEALHHPFTEDAEVEEIHEAETLNLNDLGKQMVEKALERNNGNRKKAAKELGISDRTLYRRIKAYKLGDNDEAEDDDDDDVKK